MYLGAFLIYNYSYRIFYLLICPELLLELHQIFGSALLLFLLNILMDLLHLDYLYISLSIFHKLLLLFARLLNLLVSLLLGRLYMLYMQL